MRHRRPQNRPSCGIPLILVLLTIPASGCGPRPGEDVPEVDREASSSPAPTGSAPTLEFEARYPVGFSALNGVRELSDGSILAADPLSQVLLRIDPTLSEADILGRTGPGPQEYLQPDQVFPLPGDSSLLVDLGKAQLTTVLPDGSFGSGFSMILPSDGGFGHILHPRFVNAAGDLYNQAARSRGAGPPDSAAIVRYNRATRTLDTAATVWLPEANSRRSRSHGYLPKLLEERDEWAVAADGAVAVVRAHGHFVEWTHPDGRKVSGLAREFPTHPVEGRDREALLTELQSEAISMAVVASRSGSVSRMTMSRGVSNAGDGPGVDDFEWAEIFPVFRPERAMISPGGVLWLERWLPGNLPSQWELFGTEGEWLGSVMLPPRYRLLAFGHTAGGEEAVYMAVADELDLKWLERHRVVR